MPYESISKLPEAVRKHLPKAAQEIYKEVFNHAWEQYADNKERETVAHKVAWSAVKKKYQKIGERWVVK